MTICIAACLFLLRTGSLSVNRDVGSATPTTGAAWPNILTHANAKSSPAARIFFMGAILRQPKSRCQGGWRISPPIQERSDRKTSSHSERPDSKSWRSRPIRNANREDDHDQATNRDHTHIPCWQQRGRGGIAEACG